MKTTIDIADPLLEQARRLAASQGTTVKTLVELGLRRVIADRQRDGDFQLRRVTFRGDGLQPGLDGRDWGRLRELAYVDGGT